MIIKEHSHPSTRQTDVNIEDYLVDSNANEVSTDDSFGQTGGHDDVKTAVPSESTQPVPPGGVPFLTRSTATSHPTMSSTYMSSSS
ncbi:hypothetical protein ACLOJK_023323 [Asimina triloba]